MHPFIAIVVLIVSVVLFTVALEGVWAIIQGVLS
jgi:hypothetical protein